MAEGFFVYKMFINRKKFQISLRIQKPGLLSPGFDSVLFGLGPGCQRMLAQGIWLAA